MSDPAQTAHLLHRFAEQFITDRVDEDGDAADVWRGMVGGLIDRDPGDRWNDLIDRVRHAQTVEDTLAYQFRAAELECSTRDVAEALWRLVHNPGSKPCPVCLESRSGPAWRIAANTEPGLWDGKCRPHYLRRQAAS